MKQIWIKEVIRIKRKDKYNIYNNKKKNMMKI